jgi:hypothetical protein
MTMAVKKPIPRQLADYNTLLGISQTYDAVTDQTNPNMVQRIALKESLVAQMASQINGGQVSFVLAPFANTVGLMAGFSRAIGETATPHFGTFGALLQFANSSMPNQYNLKWQIVRAWRTMFERFPQQSAMITTAAARCIPSLSNAADKPLQGAIAAMVAQLGITTASPSAQKKR